MRTLHALPGSPATQPYNEMKQYNSGGYGASYHPSNMDMGVAYGQPVTPTPNYSSPPTFGQSPTASHLVTPPMQYAPNVWIKEHNSSPFDTRNLYVNVFAGGASEIDNDFSGLPMGAPVGGAAVVARPDCGNPYHQFVTSDMASFSAEAEQSFPFHEAPYQQPVQRPNPNHMPAPSRIHNPRSESKESIGDLKNSFDVIREQGAELRALRLLDDPYAEPEDDRPRRSLAETILRMAKKEKAKNKIARQLRKQMVLGYNTKSTKTLAESSRAETTAVRKGYDPELIGDKCQMDFDRQTGAQLKALNLLNSNLF
jgi:hypothetical protein